VSIRLVLGASLVACATLAPRIAAAQMPVYPNANVPAPPTTLDPGATGTQAPPTPPPTPTPTQKRPDIVVVKPDGTMTYSNPPDDQPKGYYVDSGAVPTEPQDVHQGPVPELHTVRSGDTLWDICWYYFNDPWQWPKIWSYNPQITNPHWIYPGDLVRLLPRGVFTAGTDTKEPEKPTEAKKPDVPPPARRSEVGIKQIAFVEKSDLDKSMTLEAAVDEKVLLSPGDSVYVSYPANRAPKVGQRYSIYRADNPVSGPNGDVGSYVRIMGTVEVVSVKQDKRARAVIVDANQELERGLLIGPLVKQYKTVPPVPPKVDAQGSIIAWIAKADLIGQGDLIFLDLGKGSGVEVGNRLFVVRRGDANPNHMEQLVGQDDRRFPARALGEIVVVEVGQNVSVAMVTLSVQEIRVGDLVMMQKAQ